MIEYDFEAGILASILVTVLPNLERLKVYGKFLVDNNTAILRKMTKLNSLEIKNDDPGLPGKLGWTNCLRLKDYIWAPTAWASNNLSTLSRSPGVFLKS